MENTISTILPTEQKKIDKRWKVHRIEQPGIDLLAILLHMPRILLSSQDAASFDKQLRL